MSVIFKRKAQIFSQEPSAYSSMILADDQRSNMRGYPVIPIMGSNNNRLQKRGKTMKIGLGIRRNWGYQRQHHSPSPRFQLSCTALHLKTALQSRPLTLRENPLQPSPLPDDPVTVG
ncbi:hypothetical protein V6N12_039654 [Hibiscus sabdariffa]|uniref:Uncharacterized protein n=1 Tax=Hibiscus sabdariffa TaxID=183260 RepID=A0ABR2E1A5_9ROSI